MPTATMTSKGQLTVPKEIREALNLQPGSKVMFVDLGGGQIRMVARTGKIQDLAGILERPGHATLTLDQINAAIAEGGAASARRGLEAGD